DFPIDATGAAALLRSPVVRALPSPHNREHSLEMQLPFLARLLPGIPIVPVLMGYQERPTIEAFAEALASACEGRQALLVATSDPPHYFDATTARELAAPVLDCVGRFAADALMARLGQYPDHERGRYVACGGGPAVSVMRAARAI